MKMMKKIKFSIVFFALCAGLWCADAQQSYQSFLTTIPSVKSLTAGIPSDIFIKPNSARATSSQSGEGIERSYDGNQSTLYHSSWSGTSFPVTLNYYFTAEGKIEFITYYPRTSGGQNGIFCQFELWYSLKDDDVPMIKYNDFDFNGSSTPTTISLSSPWINPDTIRFVVKSALNDGSGKNFVSCAEMEFGCGGDPEYLSYMDIFTDKTFSSLKEGVTLEQIQGIGNEFLKKLAMELKAGIYDAEFRVQDYQSCEDPSVKAATNKNGKYGLHDNPTGIYAVENEDLIVFMGATDRVSPSLFIQHGVERDSTLNNGVSYALREGINRIVPTNSGLIYIMYYSQTGTEADVKIHIATGKVNGYFDNSKHDASRWQELLKKATHPYFQVKGRYASLLFETDAFRQYVPDGKALIDRYDSLVWQEMDFLGLPKYNRVPKCRPYFHVDYKKSTFMYATDYHTAYAPGTQSSILDLTKLVNTTDPGGSGSWGPAHELGHVNQVRPGLKWIGMTEVTNNIHSQYITTLWGNPSRIYKENLGGGMNRYTSARQRIITPGRAFGDNAIGDVFCQLVPFWQLKLYMHDVLGNHDFYKDVYEQVRLRPNPVAEYNCSSNGMCQLRFVQIVCEVSGLNFIPFFETWGFLKPISQTINDYGNGQLTVTQAGIDAIKKIIADKNLPSVPSDLHLIDDGNWNDAKWKTTEN
jgi:hypothetical protein